MYLSSEDDADRGGVRSCTYRLGLGCFNSFIGGIVALEVDLYPPKRLSSPGILLRLICVHVTAVYLHLSLFRRGRRPRRREVLHIQVLPLLTGEPNQRVQTTPNLRQETGSCTGRRQLSRCTFHGRIGPCLKTHACHPGSADTLPR
ncbi:hypothetical protein E2C01_033895 [Portunus trituberculatus]|uniref:Uncharacterized protein n=1 Tax=Portunus trituberculatus TaxID=210409 RepID=A0A5B7F5A7_PORTR|nr:hypothetical protein [Portunus trituberculatus]